MRQVLFPLNIFRKPEFVGWAGSFLIFLGQKEDINFTSYQIYGVATLIGAGEATMLVTRQVLKRKHNWGRHLVVIYTEGRPLRPDIL